MRHRIPPIVGLGVLALALDLGSPASASLVLSFDQASYSINNPGGSVAVGVYLAQVPGGPQVGPGNELISGAVRLTFADPAGVARVATDAAVIPGPAFDDASVLVSPTGVELSLLSLPGLTLPSPLLLGTFTFTALAPGVTTIRVTDLDRLSLDFTTTNLDDLDAALTGGTATISVAAVPEPATLVSASLGTLVGLGSCLRRWRRRGFAT
ncbi:MAG TPA: hypothetical protein VF590_14595 [Isosphaeraceae bacterium]|jgi:hypothetical protein